MSLISEDYYRKRYCPCLTSQDFKKGNRTIQTHTLLTMDDDNDATMITMVNNL